jgi:hypothetical protein
VTNASTSADKRIREQCTLAMSDWKTFRRKVWYVWASVHRPCPTCEVKKGEACENLALRKKGKTERTQWPHEDRISWPKMLDGLKKRGYVEN